MIETSSTTGRRQANGAPRMVFVVFVLFTLAESTATEFETGLLGRSG